MTYFPAAHISFDLIALAASAGGINALIEVLGGLPNSFPAGIVIVQHLLPTRPTVLPDVLGRRTALSIQQAKEHDCLQPGIAFLAPPDYHLLILPDQTLSLSHSPPQAFVRPSADLLFQTAAECFRERMIGVILSGSGKDGSIGAGAIHRAGGRMIAQDPASTSYTSMPQAAILTGFIDYILPLKAIAPALISLVHTGRPT